MMSRITIDLKKRAGDDAQYNLGRMAVGNEEGLCYYQLFHIRFRDIITLQVAAQGPAVIKAHGLMGDPGND